MTNCKCYQYLFALALTCILLATPHRAYGACGIKNKGDLTLASVTCSIDANTIEGVDNASAETAYTNNARLTLTNASITINSNASLLAGSLTLNGTSTISTLASGTTIKPGNGVWVSDSDADGWAADATLYAATASGRRRLGLMRSNTDYDCLDSSYSQTNQCCGAVGSACASDGGCCSGICATNTDNDNFFSAAAGHSGSCKATLLPFTDCYDINANAYPGSTYCGSVNRGDGSYDYNCSNTQTTCDTTYNYASTSYLLYANHGVGSCKNNNAGCRSNNAYVYAPQSTACGQVGGSCSNLAWHEEGCGDCGESPDSQYRCFAVTVGTQGCR